MASYYQMSSGFPPQDTEEAAAASTTYYMSSGFIAEDSEEAGPATPIEVTGLADDMNAL